MTVFAPERSALLALDFQNAFLRDSPLAPSDADALARLDAATQATARALARARAAGVTVVHVRVAFDDEYHGANPHSPMMRYMRANEALLIGDPGTDFDRRVAPRPGEALVTKRGVSAFAGTDLALVLRTRHIDTLLIAGVVTHYAVAGTAREAVDRGFQVLVLEDCCASGTVARHDAAIADLRFLCSVTTTDQAFGPG